MLQRGAVNFHGENLSPFLPTVQFGMEVQNAFGGSLSRQGSGAIGAQAEYDLLSRNNGFNTGRAGQGVVLNWDDRSLGGIGIPGRIGKFQIGMSSIGEGDDGLSSFKQGGKNWNLYGNIQPFSQIKNKWISGLTFEAGNWFCNVDTRGIVSVTVAAVSESKTTAMAAGKPCSRRAPLGKGWVFARGAGIVYNVGPQTFRLAYTKESAADDGGTRGNKRIKRLVDRQ